MRGQVPPHLEPMGLLWAMEPDRPFWSLVKRDVQKPFVVELEVLDGQEPDRGWLLSQAVQERHFMAPGVRDEVKETKDGLLDVVEGFQSPLVETKSFIPVERSDTTLLFLVGQDDHNWKGEFYADEISKHLQAHGKEKP
ncbi:hypothetical protein U0070_018542 [Myodes glareolus]|uniref:BAAT/Acyl-CoA thioester hydrolase C-terminal domain-containing protein n=1 Tax=Myodes glareolus TaxID=447135 RepID=A0AAW0HBE8_MYOGA